MPFVTTGLVSFACVLQAQTPPGDLTGMSLQDLLATKIVTDHKASQPTELAAVEEGVPIEKAVQSRWHFSVDYIFVKFDDYLIGSERLEANQILWSTFPVPPRPQYTYPIVPTVIEQQAVTFDIAYDVTDDISLSLHIPYIMQSTKHISAIPSFNEFTIHSDGLGDLAAGISWLAWVENGNSILISGDVSFPTGAINKTGLTPRGAPSNSILPYTMQLGSGTFDFTPGVAYVGWSENWIWGVGGDATIRTGRNYRGYRLGNVYEIDAFVRYVESDWVQPSFRLTTRFWDNIHGEDSALLVPALPNNPYPAPVTDPNTFGGTKILALPGLRFSYPDGWGKGQYLEVEGGVPVYQYLNGPQPAEDWRISVGLSFNF